MLKYQVAQRDSIDLTLFCKITSKTKTPTVYSRVKQNQIDGSDSYTVFVAKIQVASGTP